MCDSFPSINWNPILFRSRAAVFIPSPGRTNSRRAAVRVRLSRFEVVVEIERAAFLKGGAFLKINSVRASDSLVDCWLLKIDQEQVSA